MCHVGNNWCAWPAGFPHRQSPLPRPSCGRVQHSFRRLARPLARQVGRRPNHSTRGAITKHPVSQRASRLGGWANWWVSARWFAHFLGQAYPFAFHTWTARARLSRHRKSFRECAGGYTTAAAMASSQQASDRTDAAARFPLRVGDPLLFCLTPSVSVLSFCSERLRLTSSDRPSSFFVTTACGCLRFA